MNKSVLMIMGGALLVALLVAVVVQKKLSPGTPETQSTTTEILVAKQNLAIGAALKPEDVRWQAWPDDTLFKGVIKKSEQPDENKLAVYDVPLRRELSAGEPVTTQALIPDVKGGGNFMAAAIAPGMRAMAVDVKANTTAGGFVTTGDRVDVILSYAPELPADTEKFGGTVIQRYASETILSDIRVLAVDQVAKEDDREAKIAKTVTLEVTRNGAQTLALAQKMGDITLSLRRLGEVDTAAPTITTDVTTSQVLRTLNRMKSQSQGASNNIRMYSGNTIQNVPVRQSPAGDARRTGE